MWDCWCWWWWWWLEIIDWAVIGICSSIQGYEPGLWSWRQQFYIHNIHNCIIRGSRFRGMIVHVTHTHFLAYPPRKKKENNKNHKTRKKRNGWSLSMVCFFGSFFFCYFLYKNFFLGTIFDVITQKKQKWRKKIVRGLHKRLKDGENSG